MTRRHLTRPFTNAVVGLAVLVAAYTGNPWASLVLAVLFVFVLFPRWRTKLYRLVERAVERLGGGSDRCDR